MRLDGLWLLALGALPSVNAFRDTSPFFFFSTHKFETSSSQQIQSGSSVLDDVTNKLRSCPSEFYILVSQAGAHASDYGSKDSAPRLREKVLEKAGPVKSSFAVNEVVGEVDMRALQSMLESTCGAGSMQVLAGGFTPSPEDYKSRPQIVNLNFPRLREDSSPELGFNDDQLWALLDHLPSSNYTVVYSTTPRNNGESVDSTGQQSHDADPHSHHGALHIQQRRNSHHHTAHVARDEDGEGEGDEDKRALFEKYQFLSPGIFMGLMVALLLITILYSGFAALGSLQVSYASFAKESGPQTAKKQQ